MSLATEAPAEPAPNKQVAEPEHGLRILVVEDDEADFELLVATLGRQRLVCLCKRVETEVAMRVALNEHAWDAIISDHHLPAFSSGAALRVQRELAADLPFIIVSGTIGEDSAVAAMRAGADDYLIKGNLPRLSGAVQNAISAAQSRAKRRAAEKALAKSQHELQALSAHLLSAVEAERSAIARDIHDEIGSGLTSLKFDLAFIEREGAPLVAQRASESSNQIAELMTACQRIIKELRPPVLDAGLEPALRWLLKRFTVRTGIKADFQCHQRRQDLPNGLELVCYRTLQEALNNIAKHSEAKSVQIGMVVGDHDLSMEVTDDGVGITPEAMLKSGSFGLKGMSERIKQFDGWMEIAPGDQGTTLLMSIPIPPSHQGELESMP